MAARASYVPYGLISSFPSVFFVALAILAIAAVVLWRCKERHNLLSTLQILLLIVSLYLTPLILEQTAAVPGSISKLRIRRLYSEAGASECPGGLVSWLARGLDPLCFAVPDRRN